MWGINIYETFLIILYARNQYEWFYMCINVNQDWMLYVFIHWKYRRVRRINSNPDFPNWIIEIIYFAFYLISYKFMIQTNFSNKLWHIFSYLVNTKLDILELFLVGLISVLRDNLLLLTQYIYRKIVIKFLVPLSGNIFNFSV